MYDPAFLDAGYDQEPYDGEAPRLLVLCTTPRTGSNRVGRALWELGLGVQAEYFHPNSLEVLGARWRVDGDPRSPAWLDDYWQEVQRRRTRNGVVALSIFGFQLGILRRLISRAGRPPIYVHLYRRNAAEQVASLLALYQTKMPYENRQAMANIPDIGEVSPRAIRILSQWIHQQNRKWREFLGDKPHLATSSEEFFGAPGELLRSILSRSGVVAAADRIDAVADGVKTSGAHSTNATMKRRLLEEHAATFVALASEADDAAARAAGRTAGRAG